MKIHKLATLLAIAAVMVFAAQGCKKKPVRTTPLPGQATTLPGDGDGAGSRPIEPGTGRGMGDTGMRDNPLAVTPGSIGNNGTSIPGSERDITGRPQDREKFRAFTVLFDFDRSTVKPSETSKIDAVAAQFKAGNAGDDLLVEGHCDERGTEEYNRALGERRALAIREYLVRAGVNPDRVHTISFGKDKPAAFGHDESAWRLNRRGEFILVLPK